jgi:hypothetical protein
VRYQAALRPDSRHYLIGSRHPRLHAIRGQERTRDRVRTRADSLMADRVIGTGQTG